LAIACGLCLSAGMEMLQIYDASRTCSMADVLCNLAGTALGVFAAIVFQPRWERFGRRNLRFESAGALLLAALWAAAQWYPFIPNLSRGRLHANVVHTLSIPVMPIDCFTAAAEWFALAVVLHAFTARLPIVWLTLAVLALPLRMLILGRVLAPAEILGAASALFLWWLLPGGAWRINLAATILALSIALRELAPFHFTAGTHSFSWVPFSATLESDHLNAAAILFHKTFDYGAMIWLMRSEGVRYRDAGISAASALFVLEWLQRHLPGRQPEITDAVIAAILAIALWSLHPRRATVHDEA
jgi:hypothetical protein